MSKKKVLLSELKIIVDNEGEVLSQEKTKVIQFPNEPPFFKTYITDLSSVLGLPAGIKTVLYPLLMKMDYKNIITLSTRAKKEIAEEAGIKPSTLDNHLCILTKANILHRIGRSEYFVNPNYFSRGEWADIIRKRQQWQLVITYSYDGSRTIHSQPQTSNTSNNKFKTFNS